MLKKLLAIIGVIVAAVVADFVIHGKLLMGQYIATASLWRPMEQMNMGLSTMVTIAFSIVFVFFLDRYVTNKDWLSGGTFGAWYGFAAGLCMGFGSFVYMPIPKTLAIGWFLAELVRSTVMGTVAGAILKEK